MRAVNWKIPVSPQYRRNKLNCSIFLADLYEMSRDNIYTRLNADIVVCIQILAEWITV